MCFFSQRKEYVPRLIHATQSKALLVDARREEILRKVWISVLARRGKEKWLQPYLFWFSPCKDTLLCPDMLPSTLSSAHPSTPCHPWQGRDGTSSSFPIKFALKYPRELKGGCELSSRYFLIIWEHQLKGWSLFSCIKPTPAVRSA